MTSVLFSVAFTLLISLALAMVVGALAEARAAGRRADESMRMLDGLLARISVERIHIGPSTPDLPPVQEKTFISDFPYDDAHWNDTVGEPDEDEAEEISS